MAEAHSINDITLPAEDQFVFEEVQLEDDDDDLKFEEVPEAGDDDDEEEEDNIKQLIQDMKKQHVSEPVLPSRTMSNSTDIVKAKAALVSKPPVIDDFIRNFFVKHHMKKSLDAFQSEWYEMKAEGLLKEEDVTVVPDLYQQNTILQEQVKHLRTEVERANIIAERAKSTWEKFRKERDFHRMHHRRVVQEKNTLIRDLKRLKQHYANYEPVLQALKAKYEQAMKEKMLMRLERDRMKTKVEALEAQLKTWEQLSGDKGDKNQADAKAKELKRGSKKAQDTPLPTENRENPYVNHQFTPVPAHKFQMRKTFKGHKLAISAVGVHPKKPIVATVSDDRSWKLWALPKGELIMSGDGHKDWVAACDFHPKGTTLATGSGDGTVKLWDFMKACCSATFTDHTQAVWDVSWHDSGDFLVSGSMDHTARLWDVNSQRCRTTFRGHVDSVNSVSFQAYSNVFCTASGDKTVSLWDIRSGLCVQTLYGHQNAVMDANFNIQGDTLISSDADGVIKLWDIRTVSERLTINTSLTNDRYPVNQAVMDRSSTIIAAATDDAKIKIFSSIDGKLLNTLEGHDDAVQSVQFDPSGQYLVSSSSDASFRIWAL